MNSMELYMRQQADTARQAIKTERRRESAKEARREINIYIQQGMERTIAVNFVLDTHKIDIADKKEVRRFFRYGCHTICSMLAALSDIYDQNRPNLILE